MRPHQVAIGRIVRPHGVRGEMKVEPLSDSPTRFDSVKQVWLTRDGTELGQFDLLRWRPLGSLIGLMLGGIGTPEAVMPLRGALLEVPALPADALPDDTFFVFDLVGMRVISEQNQTLGEVVDVVHLPAGDQIVVREGENERFVPLAEEFVKRVDVEGKLITLHLVPGLMDL